MKHIYQYVKKNRTSEGFLYKHLRCHGKKYRKRYGSAYNRTGIPNRVDIDKQPSIANERLGKAILSLEKIIRSPIVILDERKSKLRLAAPVSGKKQH